MKCSKCGRPTSHDEGFEIGGNLLCRDCFLGIAVLKTLTGEERQRLKRAVQEELAGLIPRTPLLELLEHGYAEVLKGADFDETMHMLVNKIEQLAGMSMVNQIIDIIASLKKELADQEEELRERLRKLGGL